MGLLEWNSMNNPVLGHPDWSFKDACMILYKDEFHLFTSAFNEERSTVAQLTTRDFKEFSGFQLHLDGQSEGYEAQLTTRDFKEFSGFQLHLDGQSEGYVGMCSPSITEVAGTFILCLNSWGSNSGDFNQLFYLESSDLRTWSDLRPLAVGLTEGVRAIDGALTYRNGIWYLVWKAKGDTLFAYSKDLDTGWELAGSGKGSLINSEGVDIADRGNYHENFQFLDIDGTQHLLSTDYNPHHPWLYRISGNPHDTDNWARWTEGRRLYVPSEEFNSIPKDHPAVQQNDFLRSLHPCWDDSNRVQIVDGLDNAAWISDWREYDGHFYIMYGGKNEIGRNRFNGTASGHGWPRGWNRLGLSRSVDLIHWKPAGRE